MLDRENEKKSNDHEERASLYVQILKDTKETIENLKQKEGTTQSTIIEQAIGLYNVYSSIPQKTKNLIKLYAGEYGDSNALENQMKAISHTIEEYDKKKNKEKSSDTDIWLKARKERGMMLIGKTTFNQLVAAARAEKKDLERPQSRNNALDVIVWYTKKPLRVLTLKEILHAIKKMYTIANYFDQIDIVEQSTDTYYITFFHQQHQNYSEYWYGYFKTLFENLNDNDDVIFNCKFKGDALEETISIIIEKT